MGYIEWAANKVENGVRTVLTNPWLLFGLMGLSLMLRFLFARPNKEDSR